MTEFEKMIALVQEARVKDKETLAVMRRAELEWKEANAVLTERLKALNSYVEQQTHG